MAAPGSPASTTRVYRVSLAPELLDILVCPKCKGPLEHRVAAGETLVCQTCRLIYLVEDDIPIMLIDEAKHF